MCFCPGARFLGLGVMGSSARLSQHRWGPFGHTDVSTRGAQTIHLQWAGEDTLPAKGRNSNPRGAHLIFCKLKEPSLESEKEA